MIRTPVLDYAGVNPLPAYEPSSGAALDSEVVHKIGNETIAGEKTFTGRITGRVIAKGENVHNVRAYGAALDGVTDDTLALTSAITAVAAGGGGDVIIPGDMAISQKILITDQVRLLSNQSQLKWIGAAGGTMVEVNGVSQAHGIQNLRLNCNNLAIIGLKIDSSSWGHYGILSIDGLKDDPNSVGLILTANIETCSRNRFDAVFIEGVTNGKACLHLTGTPPNGNACWNTFGLVVITHGGNRPGILRDYSDNNLIIKTEIFRNSGTAYGLTETTVTVGLNSFPSNDHVVQLDAGDGGYHQPNTSNFSLIVDCYARPTRVVPQAGLHQHLWRSKFAVRNCPIHH